MNEADGTMSNKFTTTAERNSDFAVFEFVIEEAELVEKACNGDCDAYGELIRRFQRDVRTFIRSRILDETAADDLAQEVFVGGFKSIKTFRGKSSMKSWLIGIAKFKIVDFLRAEARKKKLHSELQLLFENSGSEWLTEPVNSEFEPVLATLRKCLDSLKPGARQFVTKYYFENLSAAQIAEDSGQKPGAVRMSLMRIRNALAKCIRKKMGRELG